MQRCHNTRVVGEHVEKMDQVQTKYSGARQKNTTGGYKGEKFATARPQINILLSF